MAQVESTTTVIKKEPEPSPAAATPAEEEEDDDDLFGDADEETDPSAATNTGSSAASEPPRSVAVKSELSIPRKSSAADAVTSKEAVATTPAPAESAAATTTPSSTLTAAQFGLPEGVTIPSSINKTLLQGKLLEALRGLPDQLINDALTEYDDAFQIKGSAIRNHGAYLYGVIKRYCNVQERASRGEGEGILPMGADLTPAVNQRLDQLVASNFCTQDEMNEKVKSKIRMLSEKDALVAIDELSSVERHQIRNFGSYFMGILNRYMRGQAGPAPSAGPVANTQQNLQQSTRQEQHRARSSSSNDPRGKYGERRHQDDRHRGNDRDRRREGGRDRQYRDSNDSYRRERSRDRYDDHNRGGDRNDNFRRGPAQDSSDLSRYDPRQQQLQQQPPPQMGHYGHQQPPPPQQSPQMGGGMPAPPPPPQRMPGSMPNMGGGYSHPQQQMNQPPIMNQMMNQQQPQQQFVQYPNQQQNPPQNSMMQRPMGPGQQPQQQYKYNQQQPMMNQPNQMMNQPNQTMNQQNQMMNQQQQPPFMQQQPQQPIMGGMAQPPFMQQQQQPMMGGGITQPPPQQSYPQAPNSNWQQPPSQMQGPGSYSNPNQNSGWQQPVQQQQGQIPVDILGLADKAAAAVQMLQPGAQVPSQPSFSPGPPQSRQAAPPSNQFPNNSASMPYNNPNANIGHNQNQNHGGGPNRQGRRRATATARINELPMMVQYAVQNLQATHQVDGPLDEGMLGMIKDLPEPMALAALQKFSSIDKNTMRNKTAYLAGVLRRELERINRR